MSARLVPADTVWADEYPFDSNFLEVSGHQLHYLDEGPRDGDVMLMCHGNPTWSFYYRNLVRAFSPDFRCVVPDHIGAGLSDKPQDWPYRLSDHVDNLEKLVLELDLRDITLVLHDWGGAIGMGLACRHPDRIRRFVVFNTAAFLSQKIPFSIDICRIPVFGDLAIRGFNGFARAAQVRAIYDRGKLAGPVKAGYLAPYDSWQNRIGNLRFVQDIPLNASHPSYDALKSIDENLEQFRDRPMLIVWGDDDFCFTPEFRAEWEKRFPDAEVHALEDAGHFVIEDAKDDVLKWMKDYLARS